MLDAVDADAQRDHAQMLTEVHPVDHQRHQVQLAQRRGEQLGQRGLGRGHEPARHRRLARRAGRPARPAARPVPARPGSGDADEDRPAGVPGRRSRSPVSRSSPPWFSVEPSANPERMLDTVDADAQRHHAQCSPKCTPSIINATRSSPDRSGCQQPGQRGLGRRYEPARHRGLARRAEPSSSTRSPTGSSTHLEYKFPTGANRHQLGRHIRRSNDEKNSRCP